MLLYLNNMCAQITSENNNNCFLLIITDSFMCLKLRPNNGIVVSKRVGNFTTLTIHIIWFDLQNCQHSSGFKHFSSRHQNFQEAAVYIGPPPVTEDIDEDSGVRTNWREYVCVRVCVCGGGDTAVYSLLLVSSREVKRLASGRQRALCSLLAAVKCA